jgi:hypothetical protein
MAVTELAGASAPAGLDELIERLLERHNLQLNTPAILRPGEPGRPCRCDHPIGVPDDRLPNWVRCLLCGRDL